MNRIIDKRGSKKTYKLMLDAKSSDISTIVCANPSAMKEKSYSYGIIGLDFMSYEQFANHCNPKEIGDYYIDELEDFIRYLAYSSSLKGTFKGFTITAED